LHITAQLQKLHERRAIAAGDGVEELLECSLALGHNVLGEARKPVALGRRGRA
jgi:hypothetical protein